jgi:ribosomal protein S18 acetylase RimI-like enzyme
MKSSDITIRPATEADAALIAQVVAMAIGDEEGVRHYCGEQYLDVLADIASQSDTQYSWQQTLVAEVDGEAVGAVVGYDGGELSRLREGTYGVIRKTIAEAQPIIDETEAGEYYLDSVSVLPHFQGRGIGRVLVAAFCSKAFAEGHQRVGLIVDRENPRAESLYASLGFRRVGTKPFFGHKMWHLQLENQAARR